MVNYVGPRDGAQGDGLSRRDGTANYHLQLCHWLESGAPSWSMDGCTCMKASSNSDLVFQAMPLVERRLQDSHDSSTYGYRYEYDL
ncbi:unnamed protein product [Peniophora sp. CBMAI 1063]|nr:unnamed protein product [Peniophora sp. CBMAI 1063]